MSSELKKSKRQVLREKRQREQQRGRVISIGAIVLGALLIFGLLIYPNLKPVDVASAASFERPNADFNATGDPNAPITITEYSDFQCPYCKRFADDTEKQLVETYAAAGRSRFVYRSFGLFIGPESQASAEAAYCAGDQGKFWQYHDVLFANHTGENVGDFTNRKLEAFADSLGLDMGAFGSCLSGGKHADRVTQDGIDGHAAGLQATPSFVMTYTVNGETKSQIIEGAQPFSAFQSAIEAALAEMGQ
ncbi:MAG: DsbA family protein [Anaerolineales bacterium]|nr:DsbA family protein [Anaerolineales bacterium]